MVHLSNVLCYIFSLFFKICIEFLGPIFALFSSSNVCFDLKILVSFYKTKSYISIVLRVLCPQNSLRLPVNQLFVQ